MFILPTLEYLYACLIILVHASSAASAILFAVSSSNPTCAESC